MGTFEGYAILHQFLTGCISMRPTIDHSSLQWLFDKWIMAGKPTILCSKWDTILKTVGDLTAKEVMH